MHKILFRASFLAFAAVLSTGCGSSDALTDPDAPGTPSDGGDPGTPPNTDPPFPLRTDLGTLGGASSYAYDVNDAGVVVGAAQTASGSFRGFRWTRANGLQELGPLPEDVASRALVISNDDITLGVSISAEGSTRPVTWTAGGVVTELPIVPLPEAAMTPSDRNAQGTAAGTAIFTGNSADVAHAWVWNVQVGLTDLAAELAVPTENYALAVNAGGDVVGTIGGDLRRAYLWSREGGVVELGVPGAVPERTETSASGVNSDRVVVGWTRLIPDPEGGDPPTPDAPFSSFGSHAFIWSAGAGFRLLPAFATESQGDVFGEDVNDRADVVGSAAIPGPATIQAVAWPRAGAIVNLNASDPNPSVALAVNREGVAAGWSSIDGGEGTNRATVWNIDRTVAVTATAPQVETHRESSIPSAGRLRGAAKCLQRRTSIPTKAGLAACFEGGL